MGAEPRAARPVHRGARAAAAGHEGHEVEVDGVWLLDADRLEAPPEDEKVAPEPSPEEVREALAQREGWLSDHDAVIRPARAEPALVVASSMERSVRPLAAEASHSGPTLLVSDGPPLPVGDALHLVMERVSLPGAEDLAAVVAAVCAEAGLPDRVNEVRTMAERCLESPTVRAAIASGAYRREVPFTTPWNGGFATGHVDLVYRDGDELVVVDTRPT